jgi:glycerol-3-phosphate acyltransferase PlsY
MRERCFSLLIGYLCGNFLTAEAVARRAAGKSAFAVGSRNPGMANIMANLGFRAGILVLAGDIGKTILAVLLTWLMFLRGGHAGRILLLYAGLGVTLGHDFPLWHRFRGGKGVASTCSAIVLYSPGLGLLSDIAGMLAVFATGYLPVGAVVIPVVFTLLMLPAGSREAAALGLVFTGLMFLAHFPGLRSVREGTCRKIPLLRLIAEKLRKNR